MRLNMNLLDGNLAYVSYPREKKTNTKTLQIAIAIFMHTLMIFSSSVNI